MITTDVTNPVPRMKLTDRQRQVFDAIRKSLATRGYPPTLRELGAELDIKSTNGVNDHLRALERKGYITRTDMQSRSILVLGEDRLDGAEDGTAPHVRAVDAPGASTVSPPLPKIPIYASLFPPVVAKEIRRPSCAGKATGIITMRGESLAAHGIRSGDWLFIDELARPGTLSPRALVVVRLSENVAVRFWRARGGVIQLYTDDPSVTPFMLEPMVFNRAVVAVVVGVFRVTDVFEAPTLGQSQSPSSSSSVSMPSMRP